MKQSEIKTGRVYNNGKKAARKVTRIVNDGACNRTGKTVHYEVVQGPLPWGLKTSYMTLRGFASWAKGTGRLKG